VLVSTMSHMRGVVVLMAGFLSKITRSGTCAPWGQGRSEDEVGFKASDLGFAWFPHDLEARGEGDDPGSPQVVIEEMISRRSVRTFVPQSGRVRGCPRGSRRGPCDSLQNEFGERSAAGEDRVLSGGGFAHDLNTRVCRGTAPWPARAVESIEPQLLNTDRHGETTLAPVAARIAPL